MQHERVILVVCSGLQFLKSSFITYKSWQLGSIFLAQNTELFECILELVMLTCTLRAVTVLNGRHPLEGTHLNH